MPSRTQDRFDRVPTPTRVGAHRGATQRTGWIWWLVSIVAVLALTATGLFLASRWFGNDFGLPWLTVAEEGVAPASTATAVPPITDPALIPADRGTTIMILNGTEVSGLQDQIRANLEGAGWPVVAAVNSSDRSIAESTVYYSNPSDKPVAEGLAQILGAPSVEFLSPADFAASFPAATIAVVLGADLAPAPVEG